ncbi:MAG TPA: PAS domain S-box protein [Steroidobacteraceae bacterium]|nr:PAS domain S-box protein [Steroidobacteraceae bacterium]
MTAKQKTERLRSVALRGSEPSAAGAGAEWYRAIFDTAAVGIVVADRDRRIHEVNPRVCELLGYSAQELCGMTGEQITHEEDRAASRVGTAALVSGEVERFTLEKRYVRKDGGIIWCRATASALRDPDGQVRQIIGVIEEVGARKLSEEVRNRLAAVVESSDDAIISKTLEGVITSWNRGAERLFGYTASEVLGKPVTILIPPDHLDEEPAILERLKRGERIDHYETVRMRKDGTLLEVALTVSPIRDGEGKLVGASKISRDISLQKRIEKEAVEHARVLELLNAAASSIASQLDLRSLVQTVTDAATSLCGARYGAFFYNITGPAGEGYQLFALSGASVEDFAQFGVPRNTPVFAPTFLGQGALRSDDITADPRYGLLEPHRGMPAGHLPVRSYLAVPVVSRSGSVLGGLFLGHASPGVFTEMSERLVTGIANHAAVAIDNAQLYEAAQREIATRERAEAALRENDRRKDEFLAVLAHELRNPLAPIRQAAMISKAPGASDAQKRWSHDVISRQVQHMSLLLDDLLDVSRITRGSLELRTEITELAAVVDAAVETARPIIDAKGHELTVALPAETRRFVADPLRLAQVLSNLLTNAAKYTDPHGRIRLSAVYTAEHLTLRVTDNGIGIPAEALDEVFTMFSQVKTSQDRSDGGLGIGLALAKGLVELHGGTLGAQSAGAGRGSEFTVRLPLRAHSPRRPTSGDSAAIGPGTGKRVLIADDNRDAAASLAICLEIDGHEVQVVHEGETALAAFGAQRPDAVLLDIGMPGLDGYEVARRMRAESGAAPLTLIAITGWGQQSHKAAALRAGFDHHFTKPVDPAQISALLRASPSAAEAHAPR